MSNYVVKSGVVYIKLEDGRLWCPSLQGRGTRYNVSRIDLKKKKNNDYITNNFIAIDFETATQKERYPCQIGITVVRDGLIDESFSRLIQPHNNEYSQSCITVHHITPQHTADEPLFPEVWSEIKHYFECEFIVAHNASFDIDVLCKALDFYNLEKPEILGYACTCDIFNREPLNILCQKYGIKLNHHDAKSDSEACAKLYLCHINNTPQQQIVETPKQAILFDDSLFQNHAPLKGDLLKKDLSSANPKNPFYNRKVVITGVFNQDRTELGTILKNMGADNDTSISKKTNFVLIGKEPGTSKIEKLNKLLHDGWNIKRLYQEDIDNILNGNWEGYHVPEINSKDLNLTYEHYLKHLYSKKSVNNPIYGHELFVSNSILGRFDYFGQMCGYLGAFVNDEMCSEIDLCVLSERTLNLLKQGKKDETVQYIENYYNSHKAVVFDYRFISETEILNYVSSRIETCNDIATKEYYDKYIKSKKQY